MSARRTDPSQGESLWNRSHERWPFWSAACACCRPVAALSPTSSGSLRERNDNPAHSAAPVQGKARAPLPYIVGQQMRRPAFSILRGWPCRRPDFPEVRPETPHANCKGETKCLIPFSWPFAKHWPACLRRRFLIWSAAFLPDCWAKHLTFSYGVQQREAHGSSVGLASAAN